MALVKSSGIVIKQINYGDNDKIITIFTKENGKIQAMAKGARKPKSPFIGSAQLFSYSNFVYYSGRNFAHINQTELIESFFKLRNDLEKLSIASYITDIVNNSFQSDQKDERVLNLILHALYYICEEKIENYRLMLLAFQLKIMGLIGYAPVLDNCIKCDNKSNENYFSIKLGGVICKNCYTSDAFINQISPEGIKLLMKLLYEPINNILHIKDVNEELVKYMNKILNKYISYYIEKRLYSFEFLEKI